jgi:hypothetical protein
MNNSKVIHISIAYSLLLASISAVTAAAHDVLAHYLPAQLSTLDVEQVASLAAMPDGTAKSDGELPLTIRWKPDIEIFDAPGAGTNGATSQGTLGIGINFWGAIVGLMRDENDVRHGFVRGPNGTFTLLDHPGAATGVNQGTHATGLNVEGAVTGFYRDINDVDHGYVRSPDGTFTPIEPAGTLGEGADSTINTDGTVAGTYVDQGDGLYHGFVRSPRGVITKFDPPGSAETDVPPFSSINDAGVITGDYWLPAGDSYAAYGFVRGRDGRITSFAAPGAGTTNFQGTFPQSINDEGTIAGYYTDGNGVNHGFTRTRNGSFATFDVPGTCTARSPPAGCVGNGTVAAGINLWGAVTGQYSGEDGVLHGFWRAANGAMNRFDALGAGASTVPLAINYWGQVAGLVQEPSGVVHGFLLKR